MNEQEISTQVAEGKSIVARAEELVASQKSLNEKFNIGDDLFAEVLASDNFTKEFKDLVRKERAKAIAEIEEQSQKFVQGKSSKITSRKGITRI